MTVSRVMPTGSAVMVVNTVRFDIWIMAVRVLLQCSTLAKYYRRVL